MENISDKLDLLKKSACGSDIAHLNEQFYSITAS